MNLTQPQFLFSPGQVLCTQGAKNQLENLAGDNANWQDLAATLISRHLSGDWSELCYEDQEQNRLALEQGTRLMSTYALRESIPDRKIWIITEADRSATTLLMPEEY